jgi:hypothetical protein
MDCRAASAALTHGWKPSATDLEPAPPAVVNGSAALSGTSVNVSGMSDDLCERQTICVNFTI